MEHLTCRYYEAEYPEVDECLVVLVNKITDMGAYVSLVEYDNLEGMILLSELSRRRIRSINKLIRVGKMEVCIVMRVDKEKGYIDLSRRKVAVEDMVACEDRYAKAKAVHGIMRHVAQTTGQNLLELNKAIAWPLGRKLPTSNTPARPFGTTFEAFKVALSMPDLVFGQPDVVLDKATRDQLMKVIKLRIMATPSKLRADIEVTCFGEEGIDAVRKALKEGEKSAPEKMPIKIRLIAPPLYVITSTVYDTKQGISVMNKCIEAIKMSITKHVGGKLEIKEVPRVTSSHDENNLKDLMAKMEKSRMVADDDDGEGGSLEEGVQ